LKFFKVLIKAFIFIIGVLVSLWIFMPWGEIGEYAVLSAERAAVSRGFTARHTSVSGTWNGPVIKINNFVARMAMGGGEFETLSVSPSIMKSLFQFSPVVSVSFTGGKLFLPGGKDAEMGTGKVEISLKNGILLLKDLSSTGELAFDGYVAYDINGGRVDNADLAIKSPESVEQALNLARTMMNNDLNEESKGLWRLKRVKNDE
jgi:hypothetical protein